MPDLSPPATVALLGDGGLARAIATRLTASGVQVHLSSRTSPANSASSGETAVTRKRVDASDFSAVEQFLGEADSDGSLIGVVNCAGSLLLKPAHLTTGREFEETITANLTTAFAAVRAAAKVLGRRGGAVILVSSAAARLGMPNHEAIAAAKAGVAGLTRAAAASYARRGLRVNAIAPGLMDTPMTERITGSEKALEASRSAHPLGRIGSPEEVAGLVTWLLGPDATWVTGQVWGIDGGLGTVKGA